MERKKWPQTGRWFFVPFSEDGKVLKSQISQLVREQNTFLQHEINIAMTGLQNLHSPKTVETKTNKTKLVPFITWLLAIKSESFSIRETIVCLIHERKSATNGSHRFQF